MTMFHGRPSAVINRPLHPDLAKEGHEKGNGTSWTALALSEPAAAIRWMAQGCPELAEGPERTAQEKLRVEAMLRPRKVAYREGK